MKYRFKLPIGDWSNDGHGQCEYFFVKSNVPVEELVDPYIKACAKYGIQFICKEYEENTIDLETLSNLIEYGFELNYLSGSVILEPKNVAQLIIDAIMKVDSSIKLEIVEEEDLPEFNNWLGQKVKGITRGSVFSLPGYGLFT